MKNQFMFIILLVLPNIILCGCVDNENHTYLDDIVIIHHEFNHREDWLKIKEVTGIIENIGNVSFNKITVKVSFFNEDNYLLIEKYAFINNLQSMQNKSFRVVYENYEKFYDDVSYYKVEVTDFKLNDLIK